MIDEPFVAVAETHSGAVLFAGDLAYKIKKPVSLGFVDWTERADRVAAVETELLLNRRLAPDVYLGTGWLPRPGGDDEPVLIMRRLPANRRLSTLVEGGQDVDDVLRHLSHRLAAFHLASDATQPAADAAVPGEVLRRWTVNHERLEPFFGRWIDGRVAEAVFERAETYIAGRGDLFESRAAAGWARDGHGDLLCDDVFCLDDGPRILDCLDFDERLRLGDVLGDIAFLAMDLERLGRADLGWRLLGLHREMTADTWPTSLAHHYVAYRAQVRALVSCVRAEQGDPAAGGQAAELLTLAARHLAAETVRLILVGGSPGTGKSTLAAALGEELAAPVLRSDEVRKELAGIASSSSAAAGLGAGIYTRAWTEQTYTELLRRADRLLRHGETVILDATWAERDHRFAARAVADAARAEVVELRCVAPDAVAAARAGARARSGGDASDADAGVAAALATTFEAWAEAHEVRTDSSKEAAVRVALAAIEAQH